MEQDVTRWNKVEQHGTPLKNMEHGWTTWNMMEKHETKRNKMEILKKWI